MTLGSRRTRGRPTSVLLAFLSALAVGVSCGNPARSLRQAAPSASASSTMAAASPVQQAAPATADSDYPTPEILQRSVLYSNPAMLRDLYGKVQAGGPVKIGFLGGSITEGAHSTSLDRRFSSLLVAYLDGYYAPSFIEINVGRSGTDSVTGVFRVERDLLAYSPDLIVLDYGVNDAGVPEQRIAYEDLIRRILARNIALMGLFAMTETGQNQQSWQGELCQRYGVPAISYRDAYYPLIQDGTMTWSNLAADFVHPNDSGHRLISLLLSDYITTTLSLEPPTFDRALPPPLYGTDFMTTTVYQHGDDTAALLGNEGWSVEADVPANYFGGNPISAQTPGSSYRLRFEGTSLTINYSRLADPLYGTLDVYIDGELERTLDGYSTQGFFMQQTDVIARGLPPGEHTVEVRVSSQQNPAAIGHHFRLMAFLFGEG